ncbi:uncharacterized protein ARMOST_08240 [Armillaria ostoyae]|uniref:Uncharacterized protein n=1 Tax=Armillaria ostoyae TaxID=47428 RepID=A0A284R860_ARMOS|nr:uncharacterized protein ARMOST_08240 [Armillaria ostoyae]
MEALEWDDMSLTAIAKCCHILKESEGITDYKLMLSYLQLVITCDRRHKEAHKQGLGSLSMEYFANEAGIKSTTFQSWYSQGTCLIYLAAAATPFILLLLAATTMRIEVCHPKYSSMEHISGLAVLLRCPTAGEPVYKLIMELLIPHIRCLIPLTTPLDMPWFKLSFWDNSAGQWGVHQFSDIQLNQQRLDKIRVNFFHLPPPSSIWMSVHEQPCNTPVLPHLTSIYTSPEALKTSYNMCPVHTITTPFQIPTNCSERSKAIEAVPVASLSELEERLNNFYDSKGKKKDRDSYLLIDTDICDGKTLLIQDKNAQPVADMVENLPHLWGSVILQLQTTWKGEFEDDHSQRDDYHYLSWHCDYFNRYMERGYDAPDNASPYYTHKEDFLEDIGESDLLANIFQDIMTFVNMHIHTLLPNLYKELTIFVDHLPLNDQSSVYPFSGFVINVGVATNGHHDGFDKITCVVIPFGDWEGGELCLHEAGHVWCLKP